MKSKKLISWIIAAAAFGIILAGGKAFGAGVTPGTASDPLVSKSYVDEIYNQLVNIIGSSKPAASAQSYKPVQLTYNQVVIGEEGTEIILRSGSAAGYCSGSDGLADVTDASEITNGINIEKNHLLIVSRDDGRGARVTSDDAWFLIKGGYKILG